MIIYNNILSDTTWTFCGVYSLSRSVSPDGDQMLQCFSRLLFTRLEIMFGIGGCFLRPRLCSQRRKAMLKRRRKLLESLLVLALRCLFTFIFTQYLKGFFFLFGCYVYFCVHRATLRQSRSLVVCFVKMLCAQFYVWRICVMTCIFFVLWIDIFSIHL